MPMAINSLEEYEKVIHVSWFTHDQSPEELTYVLAPLMVVVILTDCSVSLAYCHSHKCIRYAASTFGIS